MSIYTRRQINLYRSCTFRFISFPLHVRRIVLILSDLYESIERANLRLKVDSFYVIVHLENITIWSDYDVYCRVCCRQVNQFRIPDLIRELVEKHLKCGK